jgi:purine-binding chemotaxis protein CheW
MDIAEIRKKAKAQKMPDERVVDPVSQKEALPEAEEFDLSDAGEADVDAVGTGLSFVDVPDSSSDGPSGLDLLFAATEEFALATDVPSDEVIESPANAREQASRQYLAFHLGDEEYALDIRRISEIIKVREFTDIPRSPEFIMGIISLRGVVVPVFDLRQRLNLGVSEITPTTRIVVCQLDEVSVGLLVDSINQVVNLIDEEIEPPPGVLSGLDREMITGIGRYQGRMIILLNLKSVLDVEALN